MYLLQCGMRNFYFVYVMYNFRKGMTKIRLENYLKNGIYFGLSFAVDRNICSESLYII
jgi:hypothetical protein